MQPPLLATKRIIKRIEPLQLGKMLAILYGIMGLLLCPIFIMASLLTAHAPGQPKVGMMAFGLGFAIAMPLFYAVMGFICGAIGALLYNVIAKWIGGIEVEVE